MKKPFFKIAFFGLFLALVADQTAFAQYRGYDRDGNDRGGDDRSRDEMRRRFEEMRSRFGGGDSGRGGSSWGGGFPGGGGGFPGWDRGRDGGDRDRDRDDDRSRDDRSRSGDSRSGDSRGRGSTPRIQLYVPAPHTPIGVTLPGNYAEGDGDGDGQIDLLEWRQWKPQEIAKFMMMDSNKDGFLTAREILVAENHPSQAPAEAVAVYQTSTPNSSATSGVDAEGNPATGEKPSAAEARWVFGQLDKNKNRKIEENEWNGSKTIRSAFDKKGIKLSLPVDQTTFLNLYPPERVVPQVRLPG